MVWTPLEIGTVFAAFALAALRLAGFRSQSFQAVAHLSVGFLVGWAVFGGWMFPTIVAIGLSLIELAAFLFLNRRGAAT